MSSFPGVLVDGLHKLRDMLAAAKGWFRLSVKIPFDIFLLQYLMNVIGECQQTQK
jgi:hypothetical protein